MPVGISKKGEVMGSLIYEEWGSDELILEFYTASLNLDQSRNLDFSQRPLA